MAYFRCTGGNGGGSGGGATTIDGTVGAYINSGTTVDTTFLTVTGNGSISFNEDATASTNTSSNDGYLSVLKNGTEVYRKTLTPNVEMALSDFDELTFVSGDTVTFIFGYAGRHSACWFRLTDGMVLKGDTNVEYTSDASSYTWSVTNISTEG